MANDPIQEGVSAELARIAAAVEALSAETTERSLLETAARELTVLLCGSGCVFSRLEGNVLTEAASWWRPSTDHVELLSGYAYLLADYPLTRAVVETGRPFAISLLDDVVEPAEAFVLRELAMQAVVMTIVRTAGQPWGLVEVYDAAPRRFGSAEVGVLGLVSRQVGGLLTQLDAAASVERLYRETLASLVNALEAKDAYTGEHTQEVVSLAVAVAGELELPPAESRLVELGALLHDIGKIRVPEGILNKPGPLDEDEWAVIRRHTAAGEAILAPITALGHVLPIVRSSHERWDGRGYPDGLAADRIPLGARIVSVCDAFRAMLEPRPYRAPLSQEVAVAELKRNAGTQFDPACVDALLAVVGGRAGGSPRPPLHRPAAVGGYPPAATNR